MKNKQVFNWFFDALIAILFLVEYWFDFTGLQIHELLGLIVFALLLVHLLTHEDWVVAVSKCLFQSLTKKAGWFFVIDFVLLAMFLTITVTGLMISSLLSLNLANYEGWRFVHVSASYLTLGMVGLKIALHWKWIVNTASRKIFNRPMTPVRTGNVANTVSETRESRQLSRRQFLEGTGIFAGAVLFAGIEYSSWVSKNVVDAVKENAVNQTQAQTTSTPFQPQTATSLTSQQAVGSISDAANVQPTTQPTTMPTLSPTAVPVVQPVLASVRCNRGCSFPGHCRRYEDTNNNNLCDLSEW
jgi:hypothetical protein